VNAEAQLQKAIRRLEAAHVAFDKARDELGAAREELRRAQLAPEAEDKPEKVRLVERPR
jgi:hypothetical protein